MSKQQSIFIRNPKCATISIRSVAKRLNIRIDELHYHQRAIEWKNTIPNYDEHFSFTVTRNPYDRLLSGYLFICRRKLNKHKKILAKYGNNFEKFVLNLEADFGMKLTEVDMVTWPQKLWLFDEDNQLIVDKIGRFEDLDNFWRSLCNERQWPYFKLPKSNVTQHKPWSHYYNSEMKKIVSEQYKDDFDLLNYVI